MSGVLALAVVGLLIWGAATQDDLTSSEDDVSELQTQVSDESAESEAAKDLADELAQDLGSTNEDLAATEEKLGQGENVQMQAPVVREQLEGISAQCQLALSGG